MREKIKRLLEEAELLNTVNRARIEGSRRRYEAATRFEQCDRAPVHVWVEGMSGWYLKGRYGLNMAEFFRDPEMQALYDIKERIDAFKELGDDRLEISGAVGVTGGVVSHPSIIGCRIVFPDDDWPWVDVRHHPLDTPEKIDDFIVPEIAKAGIMPQMIERYERLKKLVGDIVDVTLYPGDGVPERPLQMAVYARGYRELVNDMYTDPQLVHKLMRAMCDVGEAIHNFYDNLLDNDVTRSLDEAERYYDNFLCHFSPSLLRKFVLPYYRRWAEKYGWKNWIISSQCVLDPYVWLMAEEIPMDHIPYLVSTSNLKLFKETFGPKRVWMRVAYDASSLLNQTTSEIEKECIKLMDIMAPGGGLMMDTGCLDWKTPEENVRAFIRTVKEHGSEMGLLSHKSV